MLGSTQPIDHLNKIPLVADSLSFLFSMSKKNVLFMGEVTEKLIASLKSPVSKSLTSL